jgi:KDO2-lipid IV(A) lauroyltransferase
MSTFSRFIGVLPESILSAFCKFLGVFLFDFVRLRRSLVIRNIKTAFPDISDQDATSMGRRAMIHLVTTVIELFWVFTNDMEPRVTFDQPEIMATAMGKGKGVYVVCTHTGNFEALAMKLSRSFAKVTTPVKKVGSMAGVNRFIFENRSKQGMDAFVRTRKGEGFIAMRRALEEKRIAGFMLDQARPGEPRIPLFGKPAKTNTSLGAIWERCPAPIIPAYSERIGFARHVVHLLPEVPFKSSGDPQADILSRAVQCNTIVEDIIRRCPDQYWWVHDRWK